MNDESYPVKTSIDEKISGHIFFSDVAIYSYALDAYSFPYRITMFQILVVAELKNLQATWKQSCSININLLQICFLKHLYPDLFFALIDIF